jgi:hypothetical protein
MDTHTQTQTHDPLAEAYAESVDHERSAWQELQSHAPGSAERINAWKTWSEAISRTNDAWRRLSARRFASSPYTGRRVTAGSHAGA